MSRAKVTILDGGMGHLLKERGHAVPGLPFDQQFLASTLLNVADPQAVACVHREYINAGCDVITTNNFAATEFNLSKIGKQNDISRLTEAAALAAKQARAGSSTRVAGSLPPLQESYQVERLPAPQDMVRQYGAIAAALAPHVDLFLCETLSTAQEAGCAARAAAVHDKPLWVSLSLEDSLAGCLRSGEPLERALAALQGAGQLRAVLLNCCAPAAVTHCMPRLRELVPADTAVGAYANGFKTTTTQWLKGQSAPELQVDAGDYDADGTITPAGYLEHAWQWVQAGATIVGGCCGIGPAHIALLARELAGGCQV